MANPFKEAEEKRKVAPGGKPEPTQKTEVVKEVAKTENVIEGLIEQKPESKAYGFYLSVEAAEKLERLAKQNKCSKSKALDALLRNLK